MDWVPTTAWLTKVAIDSAASGLSYDLAIDASGAGAPSRVDAGLATARRDHRSVAEPTSRACCSPCSSPSWESREST